MAHRDSKQDAQAVSERRDAHRTTHFYGDGCPEHNRCQDWNTEPGVHYHAHDLPPCQEEGVRWVKDRWCCEPHAEQRERAEGSHD